MPQVIFIHPDNQETTLDIQDGWTVMEGARQAGIEGIVAGSAPTTWEDTLRPADSQAQTDPGEQAFDSVRAGRVLSRTYVHRDAAGRVDRYETDWFDPDGAAPADLGVGRDGQHHTVTRVVLTYAGP